MLRADVGLTWSLEQWGCHRDGKHATMNAKTRKHKQKNPKEMRNRREHQQEPNDLKDQDARCPCFRVNHSALNQES